MNKNELLEIELEKSISSMTQLEIEYQESYEKHWGLWKKSRYDNTFYKEYKKQEKETNKLLKEWRKAQMKVAQLRKE